MIHSLRSAKGGRPRRPGPREPSGRPSRRLSEERKELYFSQMAWDEFRLFTSGRASLEESKFDHDHALLNLVKHGKLSAGEFMLALYWLCTDPATGPGWSGLDYLIRVTGFDFGTISGRLAARRWIEVKLGMHVIKNLDQATFERGFGADLAVLADQLGAVWAAWCDHGKSTA